MPVKRNTKKAGKKWSAKVTERSDALDLERDVFKLKDPGKIAGSLKQSADENHKRKASPFQSAMSMLNFYINRAGKNLTKTQKQPLEKARNRLRKLYGRPEKYVLNL